ncbi:restriction endonuclease subunit S [Aeromonas veronii]|uniref:restriction endonuclease subunit S n=1 Tax=Aeromonas veronii TaxID=654 RepID=UPI001F257522|nr:restriction endonuclease subunit S [Aeromonas veronii]MCF5760187.1 restriction endonuclease subunit S [Aeromonas veronii]
MSAVKNERYAKYKDSEIEWIGEVPSHWLITRNKDIFFERGCLSKNGDETLLTVSHITGVTRRSEKNVTMFMAETMEGYKYCKKDDLVINTMWAWMGALGTANEDGICSPAYGVYAPKKFVPYHPRYFDYLYRTPGAISEMTRNSKGIVSSRLRLYPKDFFQIFTALPPSSEQAAIADYLDAKVQIIDQKIDLLKQKTEQYGKLKQALIDETIILGLDNSVSMKDSGVDWIGDIPKHWEVKRILDIAKVYNGNSLNDELKEIYSDNSKPCHPYVGTKDIDISTFKANVENGVYIPNSVSGYKIAPANSTLLCIEGGSAGRKIAFVREPVCFVNKLLCLAVTNSHCYSLYIHYFVRSTYFASKFNTCLTGLKDNYWGVTGQQIRRFSVPIPPIVEQRQIADYLDKKHTRIDKVVSSINIQIDKLKELRKALISDVVTGKIKVVSEGYAE